MFYCLPFLCFNWVNVSVCFISIASNVVLFCLGHILFPLSPSNSACFRSYGSPPQMVTNVMSAVCVLLRENTDWSSVKLIMADPVHFLKRLADYDKDRIQDKVKYSILEIV